MDDEVWDVTVFTQNRERLIGGAVSQELLEAVLVEAGENILLPRGALYRGRDADPGMGGGPEALRRRVIRRKPGEGSGYGGEVLQLVDKVESKT